MSDDDPAIAWGWPGPEAPSERANATLLELTSDQPPMLRPVDWDTSLPPEGGDQA